MPHFRIFGFTDDAGAMRLRQLQNTLGNQGVEVFSKGMLHALAIAETPQWPWMHPQRQHMQRLIQYHRMLGLAAAELEKIIPASFESVFEDRMAVEQVLTLHQREINTLMGNYGHTRQFSLFVKWDTATMHALLQRAEGGKLGKIDLESERKLLRNQMLLQLQGLLCDIMIVENQENDVVLQALLLVDKTREDRIIQQLQSIDKECRGRLDMRLVGPLPACNFARVDVRLPDQKKVRDACRDLGIPRITRVADLKQAYRQRAKTLHPDHANALVTKKGLANQNQPATQPPHDPHEVMVRLTQSYRYLTKLAEQQEQGMRSAGLAMPPAQRWLRFDNKTLRHSPLLHVQRGITRWDDALLKRS